MTLEFTVHGMPVQQQDKQPGLRFKRGGGRVLGHRPNPPDLKAWRLLVQGVARKAKPMGMKALDEPVKVTAEFRFPLPKRSIPRKMRCCLEGKPLKATTPDTDKLIRALGDSLERAGIVVNDSRIALWIASKVYSRDPGVHVRVETWTDQQRGEIA